MAFTNVVADVGNPGVIYAADANGDLLWFRDVANDGSVKWASGQGQRVGTGWSFRHLISDGDGVIYAVTASGDLNWYRDQARDGTQNWANLGEARKIGSDWRYRHVVSGGNGVIYGIDDQGRVWFHQDLARDGSVNWAFGGRRRQVATGWQFRQVFSGGNGVIYGVNRQGSLFWFRDLARNGTTFAGTPQLIGTGWDFAHVFSGGGGVIYAITYGGDLLWYRDLANNGTADWAHSGEGQRVGTGWFYRPYAKPVALKSMCRSEIHAFDTNNPQGVAYLGGLAWSLAAESSVSRYMFSGTDPLQPTTKIRTHHLTLQSIIASLHGVPGEYDHIGGITYSAGLLFLPIKAKEPPHLLVSMTRSLQVVAYSILPPIAADGWCALNDWNGLLYMSANDQSRHLLTLDVSSHYGQLLKPGDWGKCVESAQTPKVFTFLNADGTPDETQSIQGASFSDSGRLYVSWYRVTSWSFGTPLAWENHLRVYDAWTGVRLDDAEHDFPDFWGNSDEIEGITFHPAGALCVAVSANGIDDTFHLYAFRYPAGSPFEV
jgi:hypothetical protein